MIKILIANKELLTKKIEESGLKIGFLCEKLAVSREGFRKKIDGKIPFRTAEVFVLCSLLNISDEERLKIFYPKEQLEDCETEQKGE